VSTVYSQRFVAAVLTSSAPPLFTVPAGNVAVVKDMTLGWGTLAKVGGDISVLLSATNSRVWTQKVGASEQGSAHWVGYMVLPPGEVLRALTTATGTIYFTASGFLLSLP
jgi:hypothetical protein